MVALLAGAGAHGAGGPEGAPTTERSALKGKKKRPGCGKYCQQAGGFGAGEQPELQPVDILAQELRGTRDRIVSVTATCNLETTCVGAIILDSRPLEYGRADLRIPAQTTAKVPVGISQKGLDRLRDRGDQKAFAVVPLRGSEVLSISETLTLIAP